MPEIVLAPSILSADFAQLGAEIAAMDAAGADAIHVDMMDGAFVPNLSFGPMVMKAVRGATRLPFDVHLMLATPPDFALLKASGADGVTIHVEHGAEAAGAQLAAIRAHGLRAGLAFNPPTPVEAVIPFLDAVDLILPMSVSPGFGGQAFIPETLAKYEALRRAVGRRPIMIEADGGITRETAPRAVRAGATMLVAGSAAFAGGPAHYAGNLAALRAAATS
jgi:ribulose-phosphate 3-epimerase